MKSYCKTLVFLCLISVNVMSANSLYASQAEDEVKDKISSKNEQNSGERDSDGGEYIGHKYLCSHGNKTRKIQVKYLSHPAKVPCRVLYYKENNEAVKVLWRYNHQEGYCESHAEGFVEKQRGWGWSCSAEGD